jgi:anti-sigma-K factor RskA
MSGTEDVGGPDMLAAEYVIGTLDLAEAEAARARIELDRLFAAEVRFWEGVLYPLTSLVAPVDPPTTLWSRIEATTGAPSLPVRPVNDNRPGFWRPLALASLAVAAGLAAFLVLRPASPPAFAVLTPTGSKAAVLVALARADGAILVRPSGVIVTPTDRDLQLWALGVGAARPTSLGLLGAEGRVVPQGVAPGTQLLVSLEPKGGSPTGQPTGPVVYGGTLERAE